MKAKRLAMDNGTTPTASLITIYEAKVKLRDLGWTYQKIGAENGVSRQRVYQSLHVAREPGYQIRAFIEALVGPVIWPDKPPSTCRNPLTRQLHDAGFQHVDVSDRLGLPLGVVAAALSRHTERVLAEVEAMLHPEPSQEARQ